MLTDAATWIVGIGKMWVEEEGEFQQMLMLGGCLDLMTNWYNIQIDGGHSCDCALQQSKDMSQVGVAPFSSF